ncbi:chlamydia polymorphic membrane middle domain protein, partial [Chlamydia psittaci 09DC80]
FQSKLSI